jgi:ABC-type Fe3+-hydroxamate transport system substrate-binding protein
MKATLAAILLAVTLSACGGSDEPVEEEPTTPSEATSAAELPQCSDVWVDGKTIPADYEGCVGEDGKTVAADAKPCGPGPEQFVQYQYVKDDVTYPFVAILGEKVIEYVDDENAPYAKTFDKCGGTPVD